MSEPAIALLEFDSISAGIVASDAMVKNSPVGAIYAGTVHPGKFLVLVSGDTASVEIALETGSEVGSPHLADSVFLPDIHPEVSRAIVGSKGSGSPRGEALGIVETSTVAAAIDAADAGVKAADVDVSALRLADGLGGKGYVLFSGPVSEVEASVEAAVARAELHDSLIRSDVVAQLHEEIAVHLAAQPRFMELVKGSA